MAKGLCHKCLTSDIEVRNYDGEILCQACYGKRYSKSSPENSNLYQPTFRDLKKKLEKKYE